MNARNQVWQNPPQRSFQKGSSINIVFTPNFQEIVVGLSKKSRKGNFVYKHPCGQIEECDIPSAFLAPEKLENATAECCAKRELFRETGISENQLLLHHQLDYVRDFPSAHGRLKQYHFLVMLKERIELIQDIVEWEEMHPPEYWAVITALQGGADGKKMNPFHQLALHKCIQQLASSGLGHDKNFPGFGVLLGNIYDAGIDLAAHGIEIEGKILNGEI